MPLVKVDFNSFQMRANSSRRDYTALPHRRLDEGGAHLAERLRSVSVVKSVEMREVIILLVS